MDPDNVTAGSDQRGRSFRGVDFGETRSLARVNFREADLSRTSFSRGYLGNGEVHTKYHLDDICYPSVLCQCDFSNADLTEANFYGCDLQAALLCNARAIRTDFRRSCLAHTNGYEANLAGAFLSGASFESSTFENASFVGTACCASTIGVSSKYEGEATLIPTSFRFASLLGADFTDADLRGVDFTGADLTAVKFDGARLDGAIFAD